MYFFLSKTTKNNDTVWYFYWQDKNTSEESEGEVLLLGIETGVLQLWGRTSDMYEREINSKRQQRAHDQSTVKRKRNYSDLHHTWVERC